MALLGAAGSTREAMTRSLELAGVGADSLKAVKADATQTTGVTLESANSMWINQRIKVRPEYLKDVTRRFEAAVELIDVSNPKTADRINDWVAGQTHGKIQKLVGRLDDATALLLVNAVYFKGKWQYPFKPEKTEDATFHLAGGGEKTVKMMRQSESFPYKRGEGFQAVKLPYGEGRIEMTVVLPDAVDGLAALIKGLEGDRWRTLFDARFDILLYDLTSTYFEGACEQIPKAKHGYSRDQRSDCRQVVIALVVTPDGLPLAYEVMAGNTADRTRSRRSWPGTRRCTDQHAGWGDGPGDSDGEDVGGDAPAEGGVSGGHAQGDAQEAGAGTGGEALARGA
jgi:hypothetical protein